MSYSLIKVNTFTTITSTFAHYFKPKHLLANNTTVIVQNQQSATYLRYQLAQHLGIIAGLDTLLPEVALRNLILGFPWIQEQIGFTPELGITKPPLHTPEVALVIYQYLNNFYSQKEELKPLQNYVGNSNQEERETKFYQLAYQMANLFSSYAINAPTLLQQKHPTDEQQWQIFIYNQLFSIEHKAPYRLLSDLMNYVVQHNLPYTGSQTNLILLGSSFLGEASLQFFRYLSQYLTLTHFYITSSQSKAKASSFIETYGLIAHQFEAYQKHSLEAEKNFTLTTSYNTYPNTPLGQIQHKIFYDSQEEVSVSTPLPIKVFAVPSEQREIELVKDYILQLLDNDTSLKAQDIAIMAPDINHYAQTLEQVFKTDTFLPYNGVDFAYSNPIAEAFLALLNLATSKFSRPDLFNLFNFECFRQAMNITAEEYDLWLNFCEEGNVLWAFDHQHCLNLDLGQMPLYSWQQAFNQFLHSLLWGTEHNYNIQNLQAIGHLIDIVTSLYKNFAFLPLKKQTFLQWEVELERLMRMFLQNDKDTTFALKKVFSHMQENFQTTLQFKIFKDNLFSFNIIKQYLQNQTSMGESRKGQFLRGGVTCSSLKPLRSIPFKVIILLGLDNDHFPQPETDPVSFNLLYHTNVKPLFSLFKADADRYAFIEAIMSATQQVALFYVARNPHDGTTLAPSSALTDLFSFINPEIKLDSPVYPLHHFNKQLFTASHFMPSYSQTGYNLAQAYYNGKYKANYKIEITQNKPQPRVIDLPLSTLIAFFKNPLQYFFTKSLNCNINQEQDLTEDKATESDLLSFNLKQNLSQTLKQQLILGTVTNAPLFIQQQIEHWQQQNLLSCTVLSATLNKKDLLGLKALGQQANSLAPIIKNYQKQPFTLQSLTFTVNHQLYNLSGQLDLLVNQKTCLYLDTLTGTNRLKMALPSYFLGLALQTQNLPYTQFNSHILNFGLTPYLASLNLHNKTQQAQQWLQFALETFIAYQQKPLTLSLDILKNNELTPNKIKTTWQQAYLACYKKNFKPNPIEQVLLPNGLQETLLTPLDDIFYKIYTPLMAMDNTEIEE